MTTVKLVHSGDGDSEPRWECDCPDGQAGRKCDHIPKVAARELPMTTPAKRTPGLLEARLFEDPQWMVGPKDGHSLDAICITSQENDEANARHLAACWNACEGLTPEAVPELLATIAAHRDYCAQEAKGCDPYCCALYLENTVETIDAALAKAKVKP